ncbi:MAG: hypothetical protein J5781_06960 [Clostridia bacterium]|nr:hypothetical protein [Clostridia bacterium]
MELMEYSPEGSLPFNSMKERHYYAGPSNYYKKQGDSFVNTYTGDRLNISKEDAATFSKETAKLLAERTDGEKEYFTMQKNAERD